MIKEIIKDYLLGMQNWELSAKYKLHRTTITRILKKSKINLQKIKSKKNINENFFSLYNSDSCYWAGFILADGYIRKNRNTLHIKLKKSDDLHLLKFLKSLCADDHKIHYSESYCYIDICSDKIKHDLLMYFDITSKKTYTAIISKKIPNSHMRDFIRGYFDGDGCITYTTTHTISFVGTFEVLDFLRNLFYDEIKITLKSKNIVPPISNFKNNVGTINYSGKNAKKILDFMYKNSGIFLKRKFDLYKKIL
jgi:intein/homing endonuclease